MAKPLEDKGKVKFRFVEFELEGLNSTIEESIKNIVHSMSRSSTITAQKVLVAQSAPPSTPSSNGHGETQADEPPDPLETPSESTVGNDRNTGRSKGPRRYTVPQFLSELDLDSGPVPFKQFAEQQNPRSDNRKYLVIAAWLKKHRDMDTISQDHIYTCNQKMGWKTQKDVGQPFRYMKAKSYFDAPSRGQWRITHIGLDKLSSAEEEQ